MVSKRYPTGKNEIVFSSDIFEAIRIYSVDHDGPNLRRLTDKGGNMFPNWTN